MKKIRELRRIRGQRWRNNNHAEGSQKKPRSTKQTVLALGALLLTFVGYLAAGDKISELVGKWGSRIQAGIVSTGISLPIVRNKIAAEFVEQNFGAAACAAATGPIDLDKQGNSTDLVIILAPREFDPDCEGAIRPSLAVLKNSGWHWEALELLEAGNSSAKFQWKNGYIFLSIFETDFPNFSIFALSGDEFGQIHGDYGELPELDEMFRFSDRHKFFVSGRDHDMIVSYNTEKRQHRVHNIERIRNDYSRMHVITSVPGGWTEGYSYDGEPLSEADDSGVILVREYFGELDLAFVPNHCDKIGLVAAPAFPGYYRAQLGANEIRVCCPSGIEEYGQCGPLEGVHTDNETLLIEIYPGGDDD